MAFTYRKALAFACCMVSTHSFGQFGASHVVGPLASQVNLTVQREQALQAEAENKGKPNPSTPEHTPLLGSNGSPPTTELRTSDIPPVALSKTLQRLTDSQRTTLGASIQAEIGKLREQLDARLLKDPKTPEINDEIMALNDALTTKQQALEFTLGIVTNVSNAAAESFAASSNPYFLMCGTTLWTAEDPLGWLDQLASQKERLLSVGRSVGLLSVENNRPAGTAFVVGKSHVLTNLHVLKIMADFDAKANTWKMRAGARITFDVEYPLGTAANCAEPNPKKTYLVNGVHTIQKDSSDDIVVLLTSMDKDFPAPLEVKAKPKEKYAGNMVVALIGYPGPPADMKVAEQMQFFRTPQTSTPQFNVKRISEGFTGDKVVDDGGYFVHKANTSGGNSGSPILDLADGEVIGIHVEGFNRFNDVMGYNRGLTGERVRRLLVRAGLAK